MRQSSIAVALSFVSVLAACEKSATISEPMGPPGPAFAFAPPSPDAKAHPVEMLDQCDPATFNAVIGPGTCQSGHAGIKFDAFIGQLTANQNAPAWRNAPSNMTATFGETLVATNRGGEFHSFTKVASFGGGIVPLLNALAGTPVPAPECLAAPQSEYIGPGGVDAEAVDQRGTLNYQCCIHPWMRTTVTVK
jgi:plastocyanin